MAARKPNLKEDTSRVYKYLRMFLTDKNGMAPTVREMAVGCAIAPSQVIHHLEILEAHGLIVRKQGMARAIWIVEDSAEDEA